MQYIGYSVYIGIKLREAETIQEEISTSIGGWWLRVKISPMRRELLIHFQLPNSNFSEFTNVVVAGVN